jgi:hypothetical protein
VPLDFAGATAGQQGDGEGVRVKVMFGQKDAAIRQRWQGFPERMANVFHGHAAIFIKVGFKGENNHHAVGEPGNGPHPVGAPGPDLGADVIEHRHPEVFCQAGHPEVEVREIHQNGEIGAYGFQGPAEDRQGPPHRGQMPHHFHEPHHGQIGRGPQNADPLAFQGLAPHPEELGPWG